MPSLGDAFDGATDARSPRRLYLGAALLFVGAVVAAPGLASVVTVVLAAVGAPTGQAFTLGVAVAALAVPLVGAGLLQGVPATRRLRTTGAAGVALATLAVAAFLASTHATGPADLGPVSPLIWVPYVVGVLVALWSPIVAVGLDAADAVGSKPVARMTTSRSSRPSFVRSSRPSRPRAGVPADGGEEDGQLAFLLDNDDR